MSKRICLDYASLTPIDPRVLREIKRFSTSEYANPSSLYKEGVSAKKVMDERRKEVADFVHAHANEIIFTSGGTEANNLAIDGAVRAFKATNNEKPHLIISTIEHSSIIECANMLEKWGIEVTRLSVDSAGLISFDQLKKAIKTNTFMVSIMSVNNEIGTVQSIREIAKIIRYAREHITKSRYPLFHTDAAQAATYFDLNVDRLGIDLMTLDGGKVYGPRGIGALYVRRGTPIEPIVYGGGQERGMRSGTENLPAIVGFAKALELVNKGREKEFARIAELKEMFLKGLLKIRLDIRVNGVKNLSDTSVNMSDSTAGDFTTKTSECSLVSLSKSVRFSDTFSKSSGGHSDIPADQRNHVLKQVFAPHILNVSVPRIDNEYFIFQLDAAGISVSTKSSCLRDADESYVLHAIGADSKTSVRFSFGRWTKKEDIKKALKVISAKLSTKLA